MKEEEGYHYISRLFRKRDQEGLTPQEQADLDAWATASDEREQDLLRSQRPEDWTSEIKETMTLSQKWEPIGRTELLDRIDATQIGKSSGKLVSLRRYWRFAAAASLLLITSVLFVLYQSRTTDNKTTSLENIDKPMLSKAILNLHNGKAHVLDKGQDHQILSDQGTTIAQKGGEVIYENDTIASKAYVNRLTTPMGCQYVIVLPDQTKVWLNAASVLDYPTAFIGNTREVTLNGEAYFEVAHNPSKPFIVHYNALNVEVKGTKFNLNGYDPAKIITTLEEGSVRIAQKGKGVMLSPGFQATATKNGEISLDQADLDKATGWRQGTFYFENDEIEFIMSTVERWYDYRVKYIDPVELKFTGSFNRNMSIKSVLNMLEASGKVHFNLLPGRIIEVRK